MSREAIPPLRDYIYARRTFINQVFSILFSESRLTEACLLFIWMFSPPKSLPSGERLDSYENTEISKFPQLRHMLRRIFLPHIPNLIQIMQRTSDINLQILLLNFFSTLMLEKFDPLHDVKKIFLENLDFRLITFYVKAISNFDIKKRSLFACDFLHAISVCGAAKKRMIEEGQAETLLTELKHLANMGELDNLQCNKLMSILPTLNALVSEHEDCVKVIHDRAMLGEKIGILYKVRELMERATLNSDLEECKNIVRTTVDQIVRRISISSRDMPSL